jgi:response regulator of citrate/malate metabolism
MTPGLVRVVKSLRVVLTKSLAAENPRFPVVALVSNEEDRLTLRTASSQQPFDLHFAESSGEARLVATELAAPIIFVDRDWPGPEWGVVVESLADSPHQACVILISAAADGFLWQEVIRRGGHDVLAKPLQAEVVANVIKLALAYWNSRRHGKIPGESKRNRLR